MVNKMVDHWDWKINWLSKIRKEILDWKDNFEDEDYPKIKDIINNLEIEINDLHRTLSETICLEYPDKDPQKIARWVSDQFWTREQYEEFMKTL